MQKTVITGAAFSSILNKTTNPSQCHSLPALISPLSTWKRIKFKKQELILIKGLHTVVIHTARISLWKWDFIRTWFSTVAMMWSVEILRTLRDSPSISQQCCLWVCVAVEIFNPIPMCCIRSAEQGGIVAHSKVSTKSLSVLFSWQPPQRAVEGYLFGRQKSLWWS